MGNAFLEKEAVKRQAWLNVGMAVGFQQAMDFISCALHDPDVMGKDLWGVERQRRLVAAVQERDRYYAPAFGKSAEADVYRDQLDRDLKEAWGTIEPFEVRYPDIKKTKY